MALKTYKVRLAVYDDQRQMSSTGNNNIETLVSAIDHIMVQRIVESQYNGCARVISINEVR